LIVAADFFTVEVWTVRGLKRFLVLFFLDLATRKVEIAGMASSANGLWMNQIGRNPTATVGILKRSAISSMIATRYSRLSFGHSCKR